jgi:hypothetical protein
MRASFHVAGMPLMAFMVGVAVVAFLFGPSARTPFHRQYR